MSKLAITNTLLCGGFISVREKTSSLGFPVNQRRVGLCITEQATGIIKGAHGTADGVLPEALRALSAEAIYALDLSLANVLKQLGRC
ncbi:MAG: hypothetical protein Q7U78_14225 [Gallionella sp.]|nr:hypothetical protein [Gallionella sp.]